MINAIRPNGIGFSFLFLLHMSSAVLYQPTELSHGEACLICEGPLLNCRETTSALRVATAPSCT